MRESNFAFPAQNRACVCISSQLYDRRALDTNAPLPLFNSLTHLTYLTSTSPRIREIMTMDGGLERLVRILHEFCISPPPPENPSLIYGLSPPNSRPQPLVPTLLPKTFDKHAAYRFSLAFQCVVNIGVRGSEPIRSRVVQAGTLEVVGCILEAWLASKGFAVGPSGGTGAMPRESREQRLARRQAQNELRLRERRELDREQAGALARALQRQATVERTGRREQAASPQDQEDDPMDTDQGSAGTSQDPDTSAETSANATPLPGNTPTGVVVIPSRDRSGTIIARPVWDGPSTATIRGTHRSRLAIPDNSAGPSTDTSADNSRPETETEDDGDVDMDRESGREGDEPSVSGSPSPERSDSGSDMATVRRAQRASVRRAVGIVSDGPATGVAGPSLDMTADAHIIINDQGVAVEGVGVEDGIVSLEPNNDFAMGAPPGAPGAIDGPPVRGVADAHAPTGERTPRAGTTNLPMVSPIAVPPVPTTAALRMTGNGAEAGPARIGAARTPAHGTGTPVVAGLNANTGNGNTGSPHGHHHHSRDDAGPYKDDEVLMSLQLLAYLSKYPHVRQAFYKPRVSFHPAAAQHPSGDGRNAQPVAGPSGATTSSATPPLTKEPSSLMKVLNSATGRGKEKEKAFAASATANSPRMTNVFSLVERFTFRHSSSDLDSPHPPPTLPPEIQYWAGVIMRNACRKDDSRGGIRQCANMLCGRWESFPREFAKCRRCRKAKYCGKECQSTAWSEGHRFWCSAKDPEDDSEHHHAAAGVRPTALPNGGGGGTAHHVAAPRNTIQMPDFFEARQERRAERLARAEARNAEAVAATRVPQMPATRPPAALANVNIQMPGTVGPPPVVPNAGSQWPPTVPNVVPNAGWPPAVPTVVPTAVPNAGPQWGHLPFRRMRGRGDDVEAPRDRDFNRVPTPRDPNEPMYSAAPRNVTRSRTPLMGGALPDEQLPPEVRRQIMQSRQDPTDRGEGPSVGPSRDVIMGDGTGDEMIIG